MELNNMDLTKLVYIYKEIKHSGRILVPNEEYFIVSMISNYEDYKVADVINGVSCLALGSNYLEEHPLILKSLLTLDLFDEETADILRAIQHSRITQNYLIEIKKIADINVFFNDFEISSKEALYSISSLVYYKKIKKEYSWLYHNYRSALDLLNSTRDELRKDEIIDYLKACYYALLYSVLGSTSKSKMVDFQSIVENSMNLPDTLP
jgi:hypothetical protein